MSNQLVFAGALLTLVTIVAALVTLAVGSVRRAAPALPVVTLDPKHWAAWLKPGDLLCSGDLLRPGQYGVRLPGADIVGSPTDLADLGQHIATHWMSPLIAALSDLGDRLDTHDRGFSSAPQAFSCADIDALARVLAMSGQFATAEQLISVHAAADDGGEAHAHIHTLAAECEAVTPAGTGVNYAIADEAAGRYVAGLLI